MAQRGDTKLTVRFSRSLHRRLVAYAHGNSPKLSLQGAVESLLEEALGDRPSPETVAALKAGARAAADAKSIEGLVEVFNNPETVRYFVAKYPKFRAALVAALTTDDGRIIP